MSRAVIVSILLQFLFGVIINVYSTKIQENFPYLPKDFLTYLTIVIALTAVVLIFWDWIKAHSSQYSIGKLRGLFYDSYLDRQIEENFKKSNEVKIKVTRGFGLFVDKDHVFHKCICKDNGNTKRIIKILLHYPCLESEHVKSRVRAYTNKSVEDYVREVVKVLKQLKDVTNDDTNPNQVMVKLYSDQDIEWRYYIFKHKISQKLVGFFCHYISKPGPDIPMFKVIFDNNNLCDYFDDAFDKIFNDDTKSILLLDNTTKTYKFNNLYHCNHPQCKVLLQKKYNEVFNQNA